MSWVSLSLEVEAAWAEGLADALLEHGALSVELSDAGTGAQSELFGEPGQAEQALWPHNLVSALFTAGVDPAQVLGTACSRIGMPFPAQLRTESVPERDWVRATQAQFGPIEISPRLWIVPSWCQPPVSGALVLMLDPGRAFGTGAHPTTRQCLRWLDENLHVGQSVLDFGCGSGILGIAAKRLGAGRVVATDRDPDALEVSSRNAHDNAVALHIVPAEALHRETFDVVVANILAHPLQRLAPTLAAHTLPGGRIVLAGILERQASAVCTAYSDWFDLKPRYLSEGWICLAGQRRMAG